MQDVRSQDKVNDWFAFVKCSGIDYLTMFGFGVFFGISTLCLGYVVGDSQSNDGMCPSRKFGHLMKAVDECKFWMEKNGSGYC